MKTVLYFLVSLRLFAIVLSECTVFVQTQWPETTLASSQVSNIRFKCVKLMSGDLFIWTRKPENGSQTMLTTDINSLGIYLSDEQDNSQFLTINNTSANNNTQFTCSSGTNIEATTLVVYSYIEPTLTVSDVSAQKVNVSWTEIEIPDSYHPMENYTLKVHNIDNSFRRMFSSNDTYYVFTFDEDSSSCAVFNFSVLTSFTSSIHRGNCKSESNAVLTALPSLPNVTLLESSINHLLTKDVRGISLTVSFLPASVCSEMYHVTGYMLEVVGQTGIVSLNRCSNNLTSPTSISSNNLEENTEYIFRVITYNNVGNTSTRNKTFYTTDVQTVNATALENEKQFVVHCDFITGSDTQGCMVVLVGEKGNTSANLTRENDCNCSNMTVNVTQQVSCYNQVFGFDIESNGSLGTLAVLGIITTNMNVMCTPNGNQSIMVNIILGALVLILALVIILCMTVAISYYFYKVKRPLSNTSYQVNDERENENNSEEVTPLYDSPKKEPKNKVDTRTSEDDLADHHYHLDNEGSQEVNTSSNNYGYAQLNEDSATEHHYFVLESSSGKPQKETEDIDADPELPPPYKPDVPQPPACVS